MFNEEEKIRYSRHFILPGFGKQAQEKLKKARVLVVGAGGLGSPVLQYLAAAGVGKLGIIDDDMVSLSNLQRQILYNVDDIGKPKVDAAQTQELESTPEVHRPCLCSLDHANHRMTHQWQVVILCKLRLLT